MESEPRAVPYRGAQPDAHPFAEICPGVAPRGSPKNDVRPRFFRASGTNAVRSAPTITAGQRSRKNGVVGDCI